jgi:hypothetical protein
MLLTILLLGMLGACKTTEPDIDVEYSSQETRPDWKEQLDQGEIGYYNMTSKNMINLDSPPHLQNQSSGSVPEPELTTECGKFISDRGGSRLSKIEFLVDREGHTDRFYIMESAGPCDDLLANIYNNEILVPGKKSGKAISTLVHVEYQFTD